MTQPTCDGSE